MVAGGRSGGNGLSGVCLTDVVVPDAAWPEFEQRVDARYAELLARKELVLMIDGATPFPPAELRGIRPHLRVAGQQRTRGIRSMRGSGGGGAEGSGQ